VDDESKAPERKLVTILSADVAEYSRLMAEDEEQTLRVFRGHAQVFESGVAAHRGRIFNTAGDAILAEFPSAVEAVRCATDVQAALRTRNERFTPSKQVRFRIGLNLGDVMIHGSDLLGDGVNVAARLQGLAAPGGICISGSVYDQIRSKLSLSFTPLGERSLKNIPLPVRSFIVSDGTLPTSASPSTPARPPGFRSVMAVVAAGGLVAGAAWGYLRYREGIEAARRESQAAVERAASEARKRELAEREAAARAASEQKRTAAQSVALTRRKDAVVSAPPRDGAYAGPLCFGDAKGALPSCFRVVTTVSKGKIEGRWIGPNNRPVSLTGEVTSAGQVRIALERRSTEGFVEMSANLGGTLRDGKLDAAGLCANGQSATLNVVLGPDGVAAPDIDAARFDGSYAGPICYGEAPNEPARCFRQVATVSHQKISSQWPGPASSRVDLSGDVGLAGDVKIVIERRAPNPAMQFTIHLAGRIRDGRLDAKGGFTDGRSATLNLEKGR
jgi:class 3 adenylate cyclase